MINNTLRKTGPIDFSLLKDQLTTALGAPGDPQRWYFSGITGEVLVYFDDATITPASVQAVLDAHDPANAAARSDCYAKLATDGLDRLILDGLFQHENALRIIRAEVNALDVAAGRPQAFTAGQAAQITKAQFRDAVIARWKALNP